MNMKCAAKQFSVVRLAISLSALVVVGSTAHATIFTSPINALPESGPAFVWGDGVNQLQIGWSVNVTTSSGWLYGSSYVGVYNAGPINVASVADASAFAYAAAVVHFNEGDTIFFHGDNGFYGAWHTTDVFPSGNAPGHLPYAYLNGLAYFQSDGSGHFAVPEPSSASLLVLGAAALAGIKRRLKSKG